MVSINAILNFGVIEYRVQNYITYYIPSLALYLRGINHILIFLQYILREFYIIFINIYIVGVKLFFIHFG